MNPILIATDFSPRSDRALRRATIIASEHGSRLTLVHIVDGELPARLVDVEKSTALNLLDEAVESLRRVEGIEAEALVIVGDTHAGILEAADRVEADLIVVGRHRSRLKDVFVGTTAERMVQSTTRPLLIAVDPPVGPYRTTMLALDFDEASRDAGKKALEMEIFDRTRVTLMHAIDTPAKGALARTMQGSGVIEQYVDEEQRRAMMQLHALADEIGLPPSPRRVFPINGSPARVIREASHEEDVGLIVMGASQRTGLERILLGSVAQDVVNDAARDLLIIPIGNDERE